MSFWSVAQNILILSALLIGGLACGFEASISCPNSFIVPLSFLIVFKIQPIVVVFPAPFSPTNPKIDPYGKENVTSSNVKFDLRNVLETCCNSKIFFMLIRPPDKIKPTTPSVFQEKCYLSDQSLRQLVNVPLQYAVVFPDRILCFALTQNSLCLL